MQTASYEDLARQLEQTLDLYLELDLVENVASSRFRAYRTHIDRLIEADSSR